METMNLTEQQTRTLEKLREVMPEMNLAEKMYLLGRYEGYNDARAIEEAKKKEKENRDPQ